MFKTFLKMLMGLAVGASAPPAFAQTVATARFANVSVSLIIPKGYCVIRVPRGMTLLITDEEKQEFKALRGLK